MAAHHKEAQEYSERADYDQALAAELARYEPELLVLAGFTRILSAGFVALYGGRMLNIHPSLLPKFRGLDTHRRVLEAGDGFHGATVHFVTEALDAGPRVVQYRIPVRHGEDEASLSARVHRGEYIILPRAVGWYADGRLRLEKGNVMLDGQELTHPIVVEEEQ